jgi:hypothetical protein
VIATDVAAHLWLADTVNRVETSEFVRRIVIENLWKNAFEMTDIMACCGDLRIRKARISTAVIRPVTCLAKSQYGLCSKESSACSDGGCETANMEGGVMVWSVSKYMFFEELRAL